MITVLKKIWLSVIKTGVSTLRKTVCKKKILWESEDFSGNRETGGKKDFGNFGNFFFGGMSLENSGRYPRFSGGLYLHMHDSAQTAFVTAVTSRN